MAYGFRTPRYFIPVIQLGDIIDPAEERIAALTLENQLIGLIAAHSGGDGVFSTGTMSGTFISGASRVTVAPDVNGTSLLAFIRQIFVRSIDTLVFDNIPDNTTDGLLTVRLIETATESSRIKGNIRLELITTGVIPDDGIVIARVTTTGAAITVDTDPIERININTVAQHAGQTNNPHTNPLRQDEIHTSGLKVFGDMLVSGDIIINQTLRVLQELLFTQGVQVFGEARFEDSIMSSGLVTHLGSALFSGLARFFGQTIYNNMVVLSGLENKGDILMFGDINMASGRLVDGADVSVDHEKLIDHINDTNNPHGLTIEQLSGLSIFGGTLLGDLDVASGVTIDGMDLSELLFLINGSNADPIGAFKLGHTHNMSGLPLNRIVSMPEYEGAIFSGIGRGIMAAIRDNAFRSNIYRWTGVAGSGLPAVTSPQIYAIIQDLGIPGDFKLPSGLTVTMRSETTIDSVSESQIDSIEVFDTAGAAVAIVDNTSLRSVSYSDKAIGFVDPSVNTWEQGNFMTIQYNLKSVSGVPLSLGRSDLVYETVFPQA